MDNAYEDEVEEGLGARDRGYGEVVGDEAVQEKAETMGKTIMLKHSLNPFMLKARKGSSNVPKGQDGLIRKPVKISLALERESKSAMFKTNCLPWTKPRWMAQACLETTGESWAALAPVMILLSEF